jgi:tetratricopeptide (TPR) repeat protein
MPARSPRPRAIAGLLAAVLIAGTNSSISAQQSPLRPGQTPGPRFILPTLLSDGSRLGFQVANAVRERIASDFDMRALWVVPESTITAYLTSAGYPADKALSETEARQLASSFRADELLNGVVSKTPTGGYRVQAAWSLAPRADMVQPLPVVEAEKISDVAKLVAREFQAARKQIESVQRCVGLARVRNYAAALAAAQKAIEVYPRSVLGRVCIANVYDQQKLGADSMLRISEEILTIHPENARALAFAADAYGSKKMVVEQLRMLERLAALERTRAVRLALATAYANAGDPVKAAPIVDSVVAEHPDSVDAVTLQWRVHLATKDWARAIEIGERMVVLDTSLATHGFFVRMIAAADAAGLSPKALELASRGVVRFPADDELRALQVQFLRRTGQLRAALDTVNVWVARSPKAPNAWPQKARLEMELGLGVDSVLATLGRGVENGEDRGTMASYARSFGNSTAKDTMPNKLDPLRSAIRYLKFANATQATDTTSLFLGQTEVMLGQRLAAEAAVAKSCGLAKEATAVVVDAQIELPKAGRRFPEPVAKLLNAAGQVAAYADQLSKSVCRVGK